MSVSKEVRVFSNLKKNNENIEEGLFVFIHITEST